MKPVLDSRMSPEIYLKFGGSSPGVGPRVGVIAVATGVGIIGREGADSDAEAPVEPLQGKSGSSIESAIVVVSSVSDFGFVALPIKPSWTAINSFSGIAYSAASSTRQLM